MEKSVSMELFSYYKRLNYSTKESFDMAHKIEKKVNKELKKKDKTKLFSTIIPSLFFIAMTEGEKTAAQLQFEKNSIFSEGISSSNPQGIKEILTKLLNTLANLGTLIFQIISGRAFISFMLKLAKLTLELSLPIFIIFMIYKSARAMLGDTKAKESLLTPCMTYAMFFLVLEILIVAFRWYKF